MIYGKLTDGEIAYAPKCLTTAGKVIFNPSAEQLAEAGYKPVTDNPPETDETHEAVPTGWEETDSGIIRVYTIAELPPPPPPPPRVFSKMRIVQALQQAGLWAQVKAFLKNDEDLWDIWLVAQDLKEDDELFVSAFGALREQLGVEEAQVEQILAGAELEVSS